MEKMLLGYLRETFSRHAEGAKKMHLDMQDRWKNENSSDKLPEHLADDFCLPEALGRMVEELIELRLEVGELRRVMQNYEDTTLRAFLASTASVVEENVNDTRPT